MAFQALYSWEASGAEPDEIAHFSWLEPDKLERLDRGTADFSRLLVMGTIENIMPVDAMIRGHLKNWDFSRINKVDLAVLRISAYALMYQHDIAPSIVIDEAIGISKEFGTDESYRFINGVLDGIRKTLQTGPGPAALG